MNTVKIPKERLVNLDGIDKKVELIADQPNYMINEIFQLEKQTIELSTKEKNYEEIDINI